MNHQIHNHLLEHQRSLKLVREYSRKGYTVTLYPSDAELPGALAHCPPTLIAQRDHEVIAVEVRSPGRLMLNGSKDLRLMVERVQQLPGWDFELVVTKPHYKAIRQHRFGYNLIPQNSVLASST